MKNKIYYFIVITAALLTCLLYFPPNDPAFDDPQLFKYFGMAIQKGQVPYRDFFDHKPPLIYFFNFAGQLFGSYGIHVLNAMFVVWGAITFLRLNIQYRIVYPFVLPILFCLLLKHPQFSFGGNFTREYSTILILIGFCCLLGRSSYKMLWTGVICSLVFFFQQEQVLLLLPFIIASLFQTFKEKDWKGLWHALAHSVAGFFIPAILIFGYFFFNNSLSYFWDAAFVFNFKWYTVQAEKPGFLAQMLALKNLFSQFKLNTVLLVTIALIGLGFFSPNKMKAWLIAAAAALPLALVSEWMSGKIAIGDATCYYYLVPLAAAIPITVFLVLAYTESSLIRNKVFISFCFLLLTFQLAWTYTAYAANRSKYNYHYMDDAKETVLLDKEKLFDNDLYIWRASDYIFLYNRYRILAPDKWVYHSFWEWYQDWDAADLELRSIIKNLEAKRTKYVIYDSGKARFKNESHQLIWEDYLQKDFELINGTILWQRKAMR
ncbi:MAG: hypothetical protein EOO06_07415 [Chitinophagaceae bacterium]|nr:MAG: hypothetical protein EOO06_07415 [Chitinophagaceae bacterium]